MIVDSHCHLDFPELYDDLENVIKRAEVAGVSNILTICTRLKNETKIRSIANDNPMIYYAAGSHPMSVADEPMVSVDDLLSIAKDPKMIGIGETGLDYYYTQETKAMQIKSLEIHIEAARQAKLPLIIHSRSADKDMADILQNEFKNGPYSCVMHCFSSSKELAHTALDLGFYLSISGIAAFPKSEELRSIFKSVPIDQILVETDAPYLSPPPYRGKRNEPAYVVHTANAAAQLFNIPYEDFALKTTNNFFRLFKKALRKNCHG